VELNFGEPSMTERLASQLEEKNMIAQMCSELINDGDCIFIDSGSTTYQIAKYIKNKKNLTVITNSIPVVSELFKSDIEIILIGGKVRHNEQSVVAYDYIFNFSELNILKAFICASGITIDKGISDFNLEEAITRKKIIELSKEIYVAADSTKLGKDVTVSIAPLDKIDYIITDQNADKSWISKFKKTKTALIISE
jgi:DeoR/GlpR family transcriptional regulator of sugar metabolism